MIRSILLFSIRFYQVFLSPLKGPSCRFVPSCSQYTYEAIQIHGPVKGVLLGLWRIARCHPFHPGGYDPVVPPGETVRAERSTRKCRDAGGETSLLNKRFSTFNLL